MSHNATPGIYVVTLVAIVGETIKRVEYFADSMVDAKRKAAFANPGWIAKYAIKIRNSAP